MITDFMNPENNWKRETLPEAVQKRISRWCESNKAHPYFVQIVEGGFRLYFATGYLTKKHYENWEYFYV